MTCDEPESGGVPDWMDDDDDYHAQSAPQPAPYYDSWQQQR